MNPLPYMPGEVVLLVRRKAQYQKLSADVGISLPLMVRLSVSYVHKVYILLIEETLYLVAVAFILSAMPPIIIVTIAHHYKIEKSARMLIIHVFVACLLEFMALSSFIVCIARDPGPIAPLDSRDNDTERTALDAPSRRSSDNEELSLAEVLAGPSIDAESSEGDSDIEVDDQGEKRWCRKCWAPKVSTLAWVHLF